MEPEKFKPWVDHIASFTTPVGFESFDGARELRGTGTLLSLRSQVYLLTCDHVARERLNGSLAIGMGRDTDAKCAINPVATGDTVNDVAVTRLDPNSLEAASKNALPSYRIATELPPLTDRLLLAHGFPGFLDVPHLRARFYDEHNLLRVKPLSVLGPATSLPTGTDHQTRFAIPFHPEQLMIHTAGLGGITPRGMSGSGVWEIGTITSTGETLLAPEKARLVGMIIEWIESAAVLLCLRAEAIVRFLLLSLRQETAYFRWLERGCPSNDAWSDWYWAESEICKLK